MIIGYHTTLISEERDARIDPAFQSRIVECGIHVHWLPHIEEKDVGRALGTSPVLSTAYDKSRGIPRAATMGGVPLLPWGSVSGGFGLFYFSSFFHKTERRAICRVHAEAK